MIYPRFLPVVGAISVVFAAFLTMDAYALSTSPSNKIALSSIYTDLTAKTCTVIEEADEYVKGATYECLGIGGYKLRTYEFDLRADVSVVTPSGKEFQLQLPSVINPGFSILGAKAEWKVIRKNGKVIPKALIVRYIVEQWSDDGKKMKDTHYLAVAKITSNNICVTDRIPASRTMNVQARRAADSSAPKSCIPIPQ